MDADVLVVGGGPAGIAAGTRAAENGAQVIIIDSGLRPGGQIWRHVDTASLPATARRWLERNRRSATRWMLQSTVIDGSAANGLTVLSRGGGTHIVRAPRIVIATGARELFIPYPGWTLPNVMGVGGAQALFKGGLDVRGRRAIVAGSGPLLLPVSAALAKGGAQVAQVLEQAPLGRLTRFATSLVRQPAKLLLAGRYRAALSLNAYHTGRWVVRAEGRDRVESVTLTDGTRRWTEACDLLCCSYGLLPSTELARLLGCNVTDGRVVVDERQRTSVAGVYCAGESTGVAGDDASLAEGEIAGLSATADEAPIPPRLRAGRDRGRAFADQLLRTFRPRPELLDLVDPDTVICRCEDVRFGSLEREWTGRQAKLYTRMGMGACQGAVCGPAARLLFGWSPGTVRPPLFAPPLSVWPAEAQPPRSEPGQRSTAT